MTGYGPRTAGSVIREGRDPVRSRGPRFGPEGFPTRDDAPTVNPNAPTYPNPGEETTWKAMNTA